MGQYPGDNKMNIYLIKTHESVEVFYEIKAKSKKAAREYIEGTPNGSHGHEINWNRVGLNEIESVEKTDKFSDDFLVSV